VNKQNNLDSFTLIYPYNNKNINDKKVTVLLGQIVKYTLHLKITTSDLFTDKNLNQ
jgi:hypothetical protein